MRKMSQMKRVCEKVSKMGNEKDWLISEIEIERKSIRNNQELWKRVKSS